MTFTPATYEDIDAPWKALKFTDSLYGVDALLSKGWRAIRVLTVTDGKWYALLGLPADVDDPLVRIRQLEAEVARLRELAR